jgi:hypothetical protein
MLRKQRLHELLEIVGQYAWGTFLRWTRRLDITSAALGSRIASGGEGMQHGGADSLQLPCHADVSRSFPYHVMFYAILHWQTNHMIVIFGRAYC